MQTRKLKQLLEQLEEVMAELKLEVYSDVDKYRDEEHEMWEVDYVFNAIGKLARSAEEHFGVDR